jgi:phosphate butyryltransferase
MYRNFDVMIAKVKESRRGTVVIAAAQTESSLEAAVLAHEIKLADCILVGDKPAIQNLLHKLAPDIANAFEIVDCGDDLSRAAKLSVELARENKADIILKGKVDSGMIMRAALDKEKGLRMSEVVSDVLAYEHPDGLKLLSDGGINIAPELNEKIAIVKNAVQTAHALGNPNPRVAMISAIEMVNPKMPSTMDAALIAKMNHRGQINGCVIDGPMAFDNAVDMEAARIKGITSEVGGQADIFIVPNIEAGNVFGKMLTYYCGYRVAHVVMGTKAPILIPSRADTGEVKMLCMAMALATINQ